MKPQLPSHYLKDLVKLGQKFVCLRSQINSLTLRLLEHGIKICPADVIQTSRDVN